MRICPPTPSRYRPIASHCCTDKSAGSPSARSAHAWTHPFDRRASVALNIPWANAILAKLRPGTDFKKLEERIRSDKETPAKVMTEVDYLRSQTNALGMMLGLLGSILGTVMGIAAVFTAMNTMLAALARGGWRIVAEDVEGAWWTARVARS